MAERNYWTSGRVSRRRLIRGTGVGIAGLAGAALIGCGGSDEAPAATPATSQANATPTAALAQQQAAAEETGILTKRVESSAQATPGGIFQGIINAEPETVDPLQATSYKSPYAGRWVYPQLLQFAPGIIEAPAGSVEPQLAESYEFTDPLKLIMKLRTDAKWDPREPTNSRPVDAEDVIFSWKKFKEVSNSRASLAHDVSPLAPINDITAIDESTIQVDLAFQFGPILQALAYTSWLQIMPRESDGGFDPRQDMRGAGPWMLTKWDRSVRMEYRKNPNYWRKDRPFLDGYDGPIIGEYAQRLAQFRAGKLWAWIIAQEDVIATKEELPELEVFQSSFGKGNWGLYFGLRPESPFRDARMRKAVSMLVDRDQITDTFYHVSDFEAKGWPTRTRWHGLGISAGYNDFWVDPKNSEYTDLPHQYSDAQRMAYEYRPDEARKLMEAAGVKIPYETTMHWVRTTEYGTTFPRVGDAYKGLFESSGLFKLEEKSPEYKTEYLPNIYYGAGDFDGIAWGAKQGGVGGGIHPVQTLLEDLHSQGPRQHVAFKADPMSVEGTAASDEAIQKIVALLDFDEQIDAIRQWQVDNVDRMPIIPSGWPWGAVGYALNWPFVQNIGTYRDFLEQEEQVNYIHWWIDEPLRKKLVG